MEAKSFQECTGVVKVENGDEIVISGIAGCFPKCDDISEYYDNLENKIDLLSPTEISWMTSIPTLSPRVGKLKNLDKFDAGFFGINDRQANMMDPGCRKLLELSVAALMDAGFNPKEMKGSKTGVFVATNFQESEAPFLFGNWSSPNLAMTGCARSASVNRVSYYLGLQGPSITIDTACSGSFFALDEAYRSLRTGACTSALVGGVQLVMDPDMCLQYRKLNIVSPSGGNFIFDDRFDGFVRSEAVCVVFLQKAKDARRLYAEVVHTKTNCDGYKTASLLHPSSQMQTQLYQEIYAECGVDPVEVAFIECHATGTKVGEPEELLGIENVFCPNRNGPLLVGTVKSNIGHTECVSGLSGAIKVVMGMERGHVLPNINCVNLRTDVEAFGLGKADVVTEITPLANDSYIGVNSFGFGGTNAHVLLKARFKHQPKSEQRLVCVSNRTEDSVKTWLKHVVANYSNSGYLHLLNQIFRDNIDGHDYRGYVLLSKNGEIINFSIRKFHGDVAPLCLDFAKADWVQIHNELTTLSIFNDFFKSDGVTLSLALIQFCKFLELPLHQVKNLDLDQAICEETVNVKTIEIGHGSFLNILGELYLNGYNPKLNKLYPNFNGPVKAPMLSPFIKWNHEDEWYVLKYKSPATYGTWSYTYTLKKDDVDWTLMSEHVFDGQEFFPSCGYIYLAWLTYAKMLNKNLNKTKVVCENVYFSKPILIEPDTNLTVSIKPISKDFEIVNQNGEVAARGKIRVLGNDVYDAIDSSDSCTVDGNGIYRLLKLTGFEYGKSFQNIVKTNALGNAGEIKFNDWITFFDAVTQLKLLRDLTRLIVPITYDYFLIDPEALDDYKFEASNDVYKSRGIEVRGIVTAPAIKRQRDYERSLNAYKFVPFKKVLSTERALSMIFQIIVENLNGNMLETIEIVGDCGKDFLAPVAHDVLQKQLLVQSTMRVFAKTGFELTGFDVECKDIGDVKAKASQILILNRGFQRPEELVRAAGLCEAIISRESVGCKMVLEGIDVIAVYRTELEKLVLLRKSRRRVVSTVIQIDSYNANYDWLPQLQKALGNDENVLLLAQNDHFNGVLGLTNCIKRDFNTDKVSCVFLMDQKFEDLDYEFLQQQVQKRLLMNVLRQGEWGTYRVWPMPQNHVQSDHVIGTIKLGDLSSFSWSEGPQTLPNTMYQVYYAALNFKDVLIASSTLPSGTSTTTLGNEFSGTDSKGTKIMGCTQKAALSNLVTKNNNLIWKVPNSWSLEDAATIPIAYSTVIYALIIIGRIKQGQSILIQAGAGAIGQSAINVALHYQCKIFVTVSSEQKRNFLKKAYPTLSDECIGNSRDESFEQVILKKTRGKGVDIVLNSLSKEKLRASLRCLAPSGKFFEIGKNDLVKNTALSLHHLDQRSFFGIHLDSILERFPKIQNQIHKAVAKGIDLGYVKPLTRLIFNNDEVEDALRHLAAGKNIGKVLINMHMESQMLKAKPKVHCDPNKVYIIIGGLGGFGFELVNWLIEHNAKILVIVSRTGTKTHYQKLRLNLWTNAGANVIVITDDVTTTQGCHDLFTKCAKLGPIDAVFNAAVIIKDAFFQNQTKKSFQDVMAPKALITENLDTITRKSCPNLKYFVMFSSLTSTVGVVGQTNYGMANSALERICEQRKKDGYPALVIQWGPIGDVGLVATMGTITEIAGAVLQPISLCLEAMEMAMRQEEEVIVASYVLASKTDTEKQGASVFDTLNKILGIKNMEKMNQNLTLPELGMDSLTNVELQQTLEKTYGVSLSTGELQKMTLSKLNAMVQKS